MTIKSGHIHALIGENGCGKSTLIKILAGVHRADAGEIKKGGKVLEFQNPIQSKSAGVATIYQEFSLIPQLNIAENISLGTFPKKTKFTIDSKEVNDRARKVLSLFNIDLDVNLEVGSLSVADQQIVEIAKAVSINSQLLILDEPTTGLHFEDVRKLLLVLNRLVDTGNTVIVIEHNLDVIKSADWVIDLGPEGGSGGGLVVAEGRPEEIVKNQKSYTGKYLAPVLKK